MPDNLPEWPPDDVDTEFTALVDELVAAYCLRVGVPMGSIVTVHAKLDHDVFLLQVGVGRDAAAWLALEQANREQAKGQ